MLNKALHTDKIKLRRYAMQQLYFAGELGRCTDPFISAQLYSDPHPNCTMYNTETIGAESGRVIPGYQTAIVYTIVR